MTPQFTQLLSKEHFYVNRQCRKLFATTDPAFLSLPAGGQESQQVSERQTTIINNFLAQQQQESGAHKAVLPAQLNGMKLLHELFHAVMVKSTLMRQPTFFANLVEQLPEIFSPENPDLYLSQFVTAFPTQALYKGDITISEWLKGEGHQSHLLEESFLVWLNNLNPALQPFNALLSDELLRSELYRRLITAMRHAMQEMGPIKPYNLDLAELLFSPIKHAPASILDQLRYIRLNWAVLLEDSPFWDLLDEAIAFIEDEDKYLFFEQVAREHAARNEGRFFEKEAHVPHYTIDDANAPANYSPDSTWMPEVVMIAKSTYVWLDQLSKRYQRHIARLQDIPDEELDAMAERGFTALWLIGLWQRSFASQKIKQLQGNPEAKSSAYALEKYDIADDLGGYEGYHNLMERARQRGIRLASDMVPNHTAMDSELVRNNPDWFLSAHNPPYYNYSYNGPNLSSDSRYGIYLEDGYWNRSDAAVTFKRVDYMTGDTRYIYHGNDGTNMPWNDTAQLNFLSAEVREGVIQQVLHVARMFPIIRFDAAMVLAKRHIQRLWFPLHGHSAAVPSRSAYAMSMDEFNAAIPEEFWREVVDRVQQEVPDTLLLAEAFWMLEGYFVRTLGMHRVYNSAFMHMLKKEDNADYRYLIKNTLEFDPQILKRYVNFMNNPDEDTAIAQFGRGDKYFGVCMVMITMPGLPMFGHGQVEGFTEKYGMEYAKAYYDEQPDEHLVWRHYHEIFPILKMRPLFAEVHNFYLYDVYSPDGNVNENILAYSNRRGHERALMVYNNRFEQSLGWIKMSVGYLHNGSIRQSSLVEGLSLSTDNNRYVIFRSHPDNLEYCRSCRELADNGMFVVLDGYRYNLFLDFREVTPSRLRPYDKLAAALNGSGVHSIELAALTMSLAPIHKTVIEALTPATPYTTVEAFEKALSNLLERVALQYSDLIEQTIEVPASLAIKYAARYEQAITLGQEIVAQNGTRKLCSALGLENEQAYPTLVAQWFMLDAIQTMLQHSHVLHTTLFDEWLLEHALHALYPETGIIGLPSNTVTNLLALLLAAPNIVAAQGEEVSLEERLLARIAALHTEQRHHLARLLQYEQRYHKMWFREHRFNTLLAWLLLQELIENPTLMQTTWLEALEQLDMQAFLAGYEMSALLKG